MKKALLPLVLAFLVTSCLPSPVQPDPPTVNDAPPTINTEPKPATTNTGPPTVSNTTVNELDDLSVVFYDSFRDNSNEWPTSDDETSLIKIIPGKYYFERLSKTEESYLVVHKKEIDSDKDWAFQTNLEFISGNGEGTNFGFIFGYDFTNDSGHKFLISNAGQYEISKSVSGKYEVVKESTFTAALNQDSKQNLLRIEQRNRTWVFLINGMEVYKMDAQNFDGMQFGYIIYGNIAIEVDDVKVYN